MKCCCNLFGMFNNEDFTIRAWMLTMNVFLCKDQSNGSQPICCCSRCYFSGIGSKIDHIEDVRLKLNSIS
ncbi:unnamed protein product [Trifolium pratense]|uniref:Uncharacterized protein n=1 Tax=Trifolium pratense TaxID=57577 RepID=A0ACB0JNG4_TRIPR|nr:unnamed protein product [Trifolium pratense]